MGLFSRLFGGKATVPVEPLEPAQRSQRPNPVPSPPRDWSESEIHLMLLGLFVEPKSAARVPDNYEAHLGEPPAKAVERLIASGALVPSSLAITVEICNKAPDLKALAKERGLKVSGNKAELAARLVQADESGMAALHEGQTIVQCSTQALPRVQQYIGDKGKEREQMIAETLAAARAREFAKASRVVGAYEAKQVKLATDNPMALTEPPRSTEGDVKVLTLLWSLRPKILKELSETDWASLHAAQSVSHLLHGLFSDEWLPEGFVGVARFQTAVTRRMLFFHFLHVERLEKLRSLKLTKGSVMCSAPGQGSCEACIKLDGKLFDLRSFPELPYEHCTCERGCACMLRPDMSFDD